MATDDGRARRYKVARVLAAHDLEELAEGLGDRWLGRGGEEESLRGLAERINVAVLRSAMAEAGLDPLDGEARNAYRLLTDDEVSAGMRTQQRQELERAGVDVEAIRSEFVTHQAVYTYLTRGLGLEKSTDEDHQRERDFEALGRLRSRTAAVTESTLGRLRDTDRIALGQFEVLVNVDVVCRDCGTRLTLDELVDGGGCRCADSRAGGDRAGQ